MALLALLCCYLASIWLLVQALRIVSTPLLWSQFAYHLSFLILFAVFLETLLVGSTVLFCS